MHAKLKNLFEGSIFNKILFTVIFLIVIPLILVVFFTYNKVQNLSKAEFNSYSMETVNQVKHSLETYLDEMDALSYTIAANPIIQESLDMPSNGYEEKKLENMGKIQEFINNLLYFRTDNFTLIISGKNDEFYSAGEYDFNYRFNFNENKYTEKLQDGSLQKYFIGSHKREYSLTDKTVISIIRGIRNSVNNSLLGYIYLDIDSVIFSKLINGVVFSKDNDILILEQNRIIYSKNKNNILKQPDAGLYKAVSSNEVGGRFINIDGKRFFYTYTTLQKTGWKIISLHSMGAYNQKAGSIIQFIILISAMCLIISIIIAIIISAVITRPIKVLSSLMRKVETEDFDVHFIPKGHDEIAAMGKVFNSMIERIRELVKSVYQSRLAEKDATIYALQSQINPHFLYNTLQSISDIAEYENVPDITRMCQCLSAMFRYSIEIKTRFVRLYDEVEHITNFFQLQSIRHKNRFTFIIDIPGELMNISVPRFILQPLVENSITHGLQPSPAGGQVRVCAANTGNVLCITVEDNGVGIMEETLKDLNEFINFSSSKKDNQDIRFVALGNVNKRLVLSYGSEYALKIESHEGDGTKVIINIPMEYNSAVAHGSKGIE